MSARFFGWIKRMSGEEVGAGSASCQARLAQGCSGETSAWIMDDMQSR